MTHESIQSLVMSWEDLTENEREIVQTHLAGCHGCRELQAALKLIEDLAGELGSLPAEADADLHLLAQFELQAEKGSRLMLRTRLDAESGMGVKP